MVESYLKYQLAGKSETSFGVRSECEVGVIRWKIFKRKILKGTRYLGKLRDIIDTHKEQSRGTTNEKTPSSQDEK